MQREQPERKKKKIRTAFLPIPFVSTVTAYSKVCFFLVVFFKHDRYNVMLESNKTYQ